MTCREIQSLAGSYLDGELPEETSTVLQRHMLGCAACRAEVDSLRMAMEVWQSAQVPAAASEEFATAALDRLRRELGAVTRIPEPPGQLVLMIEETLDYPRPV